MLWTRRASALYQTPDDDRGPNHEGSGINVGQFFPASVESEIRHPVFAVHRNSFTVSAPLPDLGLPCIRGQIDLTRPCHRAALDVRLSEERRIREGSKDAGAGRMDHGGQVDRPLGAVHESDVQPEPRKGFHGRHARLDRRGYCKGRIFFGG